MDLISAQGTPVPESSWVTIMGNADAPELVALGHAAEVTYRSETAEQAWRKAAGSGHPNAAPQALFSLGVLLERRGDVQGAKDAYQKTLGYGHASSARKAAVNFGVLLVGQGDVVGAVSAYQRYQEAIGSGRTLMDFYISPRTYYSRFARNSPWLPSVELRLQARYLRSGRRGPMPFRSA
jgi:tetratricopeptide (TPR) repeat protein